MTEEDTFRALKKWTWDEVNYQISLRAEVTLEREKLRVSKIFEDSGWTRQAYFDEYVRRIQ